VADIPGLIEGAHEGKGLGTQFLRHIERTRTLAVLIPIDTPDPQVVYELLREELLSHDAALAGTPHCVVITKSDLVPDSADAVKVDAPDAWGQFIVSSVSGDGIAGLEEAMWQRVRSERDAGGGDSGTDLFPELEEWAP